MICRLGEVEVCVKNASLNAASTVWKSWSATTMIEPWRSARHRLVHRVGLVDADAHLVRIGQRVVAALGRFVALAVLGVAHHLAQLRRRAHRGAPAQERREARVAEPGLVPQEHEVGLDRQALEHRALDVRDVAVEGAVREHQHAHAVEAPFGLELLQRLLDRLDREAAVHRVLREREGVDVVGLGPGEHQAVVVRLVAVAVDENDVAGPAQRLVHDLVRGGGAVGDEVAAVAAERARRLVLRHLDVAGGLEQAVEAAGGGRALGEEEVRAVELAHVANPVGLEDRLAARHRQGVEGADRTLRVFLEVVEVRRAVAVGDSVHDGKVDLEHLVHAVEHAAQRRRIVGGGQRRDLAVGAEVHVELGTHRAHGAREQRGKPAFAFRRGRQMRGDQLTQIGQGVLRTLREAVEQHHGLQVVVDERPRAARPRSCP